jgi:hypothetical protein
VIVIYNMQEKQPLNRCLIEAEMVHVVSTPSFVTPSWFFLEYVRSSWVLSKWQVIVSSFLFSFGKNDIERISCGSLLPAPAKPYLDILWILH